ncbi:MAG: tRNA (adenosine(37)-N6)-threonylcarbamoyltransferase complex dimerization subunit type 1 TsaB [Rickettsiales bacterium]|jgi:tRNA threonylcarbamoyl adenosine modification protein YeaZ|nr:tRNA (adenosine(37)-N6)-threonylcarbamoyltransferase complex dimerization subunit type 1 TsaB [Rickettsiales bacterium]
MDSLYLDSTGGGLSLCFKSGAALRAASGGGGRTQGAEVFGLLEEVLGGVPVGALGFMAVALGPGSFTGIRLGLSVAKGFMLACGVPVIGISRFEAARISRGAPGGRCLVTFPADDRNVYAAEFSGGRPLAPPRLLERGGVKPEPGAVWLDDPEIAPEKVLEFLEAGFDRASFVQRPLVPLYIKPHYAKLPK